MLLFSSFYFKFYQMPRDFYHAFSGFIRLKVEKKIKLL